MKRSIKKFMLTALLLCVTVLLGSCSFLEGEQQPQVQNYSELTQTEVFPVRLEIGEQSYLISSTALPSFPPTLRRRWRTWALPA